jgi:hypothetical protein
MIARIGVLGLLIATVLVGLPAPRTARPRGRIARPTVKVLFEGGGQRVVFVDFANTTRAPVKYLLYDALRPNYLPIAFLDFELVKDGEVVRPLEEFEGPELYVRNVRAIQPSETVTSELDLRETYGDLKPGRYLLRCRYDIRPDSHPFDDFKLTPLQVSSDLMIINIQ